MEAGKAYTGYADIGTVTFDETVKELYDQYADHHSLSRSSNDTVLRTILGSKDDGRMPNVEHRAVGSTHTAQYGEPFTASHEDVRPATKRSIKQARHELLEDNIHDHIAMNLWVKDSDVFTPYVEGRLHYFEKEAISQHNDVQALRTIFDAAALKGTQREQADAVQLLFNRNQYDDALRALPDVNSVAIYGNEKLLGQIEGDNRTASLLEALRPLPEDTSTIPIEVGDEFEYISVDRKGTDGTDITISRADGNRHWREHYTTRVLDYLK